MLWRPQVDVDSAKQWRWVVRRATTTVSPSNKEVETEKDKAKGGLSLPRQHLGMAQVAGHLSARFRAAAALLRTFIHDAVVWKSFATHGACVAHLGADLTHAPMRR
jgi:hypothetical protein